MIGADPAEFRPEDSMNNTCRFHRTHNLAKRNYAAVR